jgi:hypothetical protein
MTLRLTPDLLAAAYEYLRSSPPFRGWHLPDADEVGFTVTRHQDRFSHLKRFVRSKEAEVGVSEQLVGRSHTLIEAMAHEMVHLFQHLRGTETPGTHHNAQWQRLAKNVCRHHGFDPKTF